MGLLEFVAEEGEKGKRNRAERILYAALEDLERRNDFEALHGHWSSSAGELEAGYRKVLKECGRERFEAVLDSRLEDLIDRIEKEAAAVWERLGSAKARKEARKKVVQDDQLTMACELLFKQADMAKFKGEYPLSRACYERLIELDPGLHVGADIVRKSKAALEEPALKGVQVEIGGLDMADLKRRLSQV